MKAPIYDPVKELAEKKKKEKSSRGKSAYDVARSERKDLLARYEAEAKDLYPDSKGKRQGHVNSCYTRFVNEDKEYWENKAREINKLAKKNTAEEDENRKPSRKQYIFFL